MDRSEDWRHSSQHTRSIPMGGCPHPSFPGRREVTTLTTAFARSPSVLRRWCTFGKPLRTQPIEPVPNAKHSLSEYKNPFRTQPIKTRANAKTLFLATKIHYETVTTRYQRGLMNRYHALPTPVTNGVPNASVSVTNAFRTRSNEPFERVPNASHRDPFERVPNTRCIGADPLSTVTLQPLFTHSFSFHSLTHTFLFHSFILFYYSSLTYSFHSLTSPINLFTRLSIPLPASTAEQRDYRPRFALAQSSRACECVKRSRRKIIAQSRARESRHGKNLRAVVASLGRDRNVEHVETCRAQFLSRSRRERVSAPRTISLAQSSRARESVAQSSRARESRHGKNLRAVVASLGRDRNVEHVETCRAQFLSRSRRERVSVPRSRECVKRSRRKIIAQSSRACESRHGKNLRAGDGCA